MNRIILPGDADFRDFSDDTQADSRKTGRVRVPIYASVDRDDPLIWFDTLVSFVPGAREETKSSHVLPILDELPPGARDRVWSGLCEVSLSIVDPRVHIQAWHDLWLRATGHPFNEGALRYAAARGAVVERDILNDYHAWLAMVVVNEAVPSRTDRFLDVVSRMQIAPGGQRGPSGAGPPPLERAEATLGPAGKSLGKFVRRAVDYAAKSGPAFIQVHDGATSLDGFDPRYQVFTPVWRIVAQGALKGMESAHAFDRDDGPLLERLADHRRTMARRLERLAYSYESVAPGAVGSLAELDSRGSRRVQAADVAAGIARTVFEREGLPGICRRFAKVLFNGTRVTMRSMLAVTSGD